jgi:hypothetical protein
MATFVLTYRAPQDYTLGTPDGIAAWTSWFESMGAHLADRAKPVTASTTAGECGGSRPLGGYSVITGDDVGAAVALARGGPFVGQSGGGRSGCSPIRRPEAARPERPQAQRPGSPAAGRRRGRRVASLVRPGRQRGGRGGAPWKISGTR